MLKNKKILIGITGGIAAYKIPLLIRLLKKAGADVQVVTTVAALDFVTPLTLSTVSQREVYSSLINKKNNWNNHVELAAWADIFIVAPLTANTLAKMANGICNDILLACFLSAKCDVMVAPAMDLDMYQHFTTKKNIATLSENGVKIIPTESGELASGLSGEGRMAEPETIFSAIENYFKKKSSLSKKHILVTAGPTHENIDPVRFIGNRSSGRMGCEIANSFADKGANVTLICGPVADGIKSIVKQKNIKIINVQTAAEMYDAVLKTFDACNVAVMCAAVADYRPIKTSAKKIKKTTDVLQIELIKNKDILFELGKRKIKNQFICGFALETDNEEKNAKLKLLKKNADMIVLNSLNDVGAGFAHNTNKVNIYLRSGETKYLLLNSKRNIAHEIVEVIEGEILK